MTDELPTFMKQLVSSDEPTPDELREALKWTKTPEERLRVYVRANEREQARAVAVSILKTHDVTDIVREGDGVYVHAGPFTGYHSLRRRENGELTVSEHGTYTHDPTDVQFDAECPDDGRLYDYVEQLNDAPAPGDAAKAVYQRTRL